MTAFYYFDACPFLSWAEAQVPTPKERESRIAARVAAIIAEVDAVRVLSEVTIAEFHSNVHKHWRDTGRPEYGDIWAAAVLDEFMKWLAGGKIEVISAPAKLVEMALVYVSSATKEHRRNLRAWDAVHICHAAYWARSVGEGVSIVTTDPAFANFIQIFPEFSLLLSIYNPDF